jgi:hypothetical protein
MPSLPAPKDVRDLFENLLGRAVAVFPADAMRPGDLPGTLVSVYVDKMTRLKAVVGMDLPLTAYSSAALALVPAGGAEVCIEEREIPPMLAENANELCNVFSTLLNRPGQPHVRLYETYLPGEQPPTDAAGNLLAIGRRLDLTVEISGYGSGRLSIAFAN